MTPEVVWLNYADTPAKGYWSYGWLEETLEPFTDRYSIGDVEGDGAIVILASEYNVDHVDQLNYHLSALDWCTLILASDEQGVFPVENLKLKPKFHLWVMTPHFERHEFPVGTQFIGEMYPPQARVHIAKYKEEAHNRIRGASFSGQITHSRRREMVAAFDRESFVNRTDGFTKGFPFDEYYRLMCETRCTPAPSGPVTPDSFRAYEALESGGVPLLDLHTPNDEQDGHQFWEAILGKSHPLPVIDTWNQGPDIARRIGYDWPLRGSMTFSWWQMYKRELRRRFLEFVPGIPTEPITFLVPTSPIPSHPSTEIIDETISSIRFHFPTADIIIMCDGLREEMGHRSADYAKYVEEITWKCNFEWVNCYPLVFRAHWHQAGMTRQALNYVTTPLVMFVEHDTPIVTDEPIEWDSLLNLAQSDEVDVIRFHFESGIHPEHEHLMEDHETRMVMGVPIRMGHQWSQRPHLSKTSYYRKLIQDHFPMSSNTMIEDRMHSVAQEFPDQHRIAIYHPDSGNIKRSIHTDGRAGDSKFEMVFQ